MIDVARRASRPTNRPYGIHTSRTFVIAQASLVFLSTRTISWNSTNPAAIGIFPAKVISRITPDSNEKRDGSNEYS